MMPKTLHTMAWAYHEICAGEDGSGFIEGGAELSDGLIVRGMREVVKADG